MTEKYLVCGIRRLDNTLSAGRTFLVNLRRLRSRFLFPKRGRRWPRAGVRSFNPFSVDKTQSDLKFYFFFVSGTYELALVVKVVKILYR